MNQTIETMLNHRSIRKYKPDPLPTEQLDQILQAAQMASSSSNVQAYSAIVVTDPDKKKELAALCGNQPYIEQCPVFLVWCADLYRDHLACAKQGVEMVTGTMESFIVATVDVTLAAQNAAVAAESLGLGIVYIGGIRNNSREVTRLLQLPELVYPIFGMCVGFPAHESSQRPRLPQAGVFHANAYNPQQAKQAIDDYDQIMHEYYAARSGGGNKQTTWSHEMAAKWEKPVRTHMRPFLEEQGFRFE